jgi:glucose/arabinose dehydrogenase/PKD repeat protein
MKLPFEKSRKNGALLTVVAALSLGQACGDSEPKKYVGNGGAPGSGGTAATTGGSTSAGTGGAAGGTSGSSGTSGTSGASGGGSGGTVGLDAGVPVYEQDDPNLHPSDDAYQRVEIPVAVSNVMSLDIDADENVYVLERAGKLKIWKPDGTVIEAGAIDAFSGNEDGALNIALDPDFSTNGFAYIYYSSNGAPENKLSRFEIQHDMLHLESEKVLLTVPDERVVQWHVAGGLDFDSKGNLYLSTGDNTNPFESSGYAPIDERNNRSVYDAQRTSGNSRDLRGKILRIKPTNDGGYDIPDGNLFSAEDGRPEIYIMGERNPFRIAVDRGNDWLYWGNVGPDAGSNALQTRGPLGYDEVNQAKAAGNFGWPYCIADNVPYVSYDFGSSQSGQPFDCDSLVNESPNNSGVSNLPPAQPAWISYTYGAPPYPALGEGPRTALAGAVYRWKPGGSINKLPRYFDGSVLLMDYSRGWLAEVRNDDDGNILSVETFFPSLAWKEPIQMRISPNGVLYVAQFGAESTVYRINYVGDNNQPPVAVVSSDVDSGAVPLTVQFSSQGSSDVEDDVLTYAWDLNGDNIVDSTEANPSFVYTTAGAYEATLVLSDGMNSGVAKLKIVAGNRRPVVTITSPPNGAFVGEGESVSYSVSVSDAEDGTTPSGISCNDVVITTALGHDLHEHSGTPTTGCTGTFTTVTGVIPTENAWQVLNVAYTDQGANGLELTGEAKVRLHFKRKQAEHYPVIGEASDVMLEDTTDPQGGEQGVSYINDGSYICWNDMNFQGINSISYRVASAGSGGRIEVRQGSPTGTQIGTATNVMPTGGWQNWSTVTSGAITNPGTRKICFVFKNNPGDELLFNLNFINFNGDGVSQ